MTETCGRTADDPVVGMTIAELNQFVQQAEFAGIDPRCPVYVNISWTGRIKAIESRPRPDKPRNSKRGGRV